MAQYLLEVGMEEIPARFLVALKQQLEERVSHFLTEQRLSYESIESFATPRRLAVIVSGLAEQQTDVSEKAKGPALKIARNEAGEWSKAAQGFARGQGATVEDFTIEEIKGEPYVFVNKFVKGLSVTEILPKLSQVLHQMTFPVSMIWNRLETPFIRPVHWIVSLLDEQIVPLEFVGVTASNTSRGHRFLGHDTTVTSPQHYIAELKEQYVIVDFQERQQMIRHQIEQIAKEHRWHIPIDEELLEEVTAIVEYPTAFYGEFEEKYLEVPHNVLVTAMKDHQRYFYAEKDGKLLPVFISVRNGDSNHLENVVRGNRKVLKARLEDALFFYQEDLKYDLSHFVEKLESVKEHFKLGTLADKQRRVGQYVHKLGELLSIERVDIDTAVRAAQIYKFDLMTQTVGEFAELQGEMGAIYAQQFGESEAVCRALATQYLPTTSGGDLPDTVAGALLALADKLDTLIQYFNAGIIPTGSNDPYALRRQAMGIVEILVARQWRIRLNEALTIYGLIEDKTRLMEFLVARVQQFIGHNHYDADIVQAILKANMHEYDVVVAVNMAQTLQHAKNTDPESYRQVVEAMTRVANIGLTETFDGTLPTLNLAQTQSERTLIEAVLDTTISDNGLYDQLVKLVQPIQRYFEENMVFAEDPTIQQNRIRTMQALANFVYRAFDPRELMSKF